MAIQKPKNNPLLEKSPHKNDVPPLDKIRTFYPRAGLGDCRGRKRPSGHQGCERPRF